MTADKRQRGAKASLDRDRLLRLALQKKGLLGAGARCENQIPRLNQDSPRLSSAQQRLWFLEQFSSGTAAYVFSNKIQLKGKIDIPCLRRAFQAVVDRHEIMRTCYREKDGIPFQQIVDTLSIDMPLQDLSEVDETTRLDEYQAIERRESTQPFDLTQAPLLRVRIIRFDASHHVVLLTLHHIVYDGWSLAVMCRELKLFYEAFIRQQPVPVPPLEIQYSDFACWQRQRLEAGALERQAEFWKQYLGGHLPILELNNDLPRPEIQSYKGKLLRFELNKSLSDSLRVLARQQECTLSMVMLAAFKILLHRYTGETDVIVGVPVANRNHHQIEGLIGFFVNTMAIRSLLDYDPDVTEVIRRVRRSSSDAYVNQDLPFDQVVDLVRPERDTGHNPIFQVMFAFQNTPELPTRIGDADIDFEILDNDTSVFDLTLNVHDGDDGLDGYFEFCTDLFHVETIERMRGHYQSILEAMAADPKCKISRIQVLPEYELKQLIYDWNDTGVDYDTDTCIHHIIEERVREHPEKTAICHQQNSLSYRELNQKANRLAHHLRSIGVKPETLVAIYMERCCDMFVAILAILKAGGAYLPVDPSYPSERVSFLVEDSGSEFLLTHMEHLESIPAVQCELICIDSDELGLPEQDAENPKSISGPENLAYVIYTSGSTGLPKGVMVCHRNLVQSTMARLRYYDDPLESFLLLSSYAFDSSVAGVFWALCQGAELHLPPQDGERDPQLIARLLQQASVSHMLCLPSVHGLLLNIAEPQQLQSLKAIIVAGEACPPELVTEHRKILPATRMYNEYGPTEGTVWSTVYEITTEHHGKQVPIGKPIPNAKAYILDRCLQPVPVGVIGELYIGGNGIARGYLQREALTAERFIENSFTRQSGDRLYKTGDLVRFRSDANIIFCGRSDHQVKIRGYRIELGEIESVLQKHRSVADAVVIARESSSSGRNSGLADAAAPRTKMLVAYLVANDGSPPSSDDFQDYCAERMPAYMVPQAFVFIDSIPLSPNGKIDIGALPDIEQLREASTADKAHAENEIQERLIEVWSSVLGIENLGIHDDFFEIGGDSILSIQTIARAREFGIQLTPRQIFQHSTIAGLSEVAGTSQAILAEQGVVSGDVPLIPIQRWLLDRDLPNPDHWNQCVMLRVPKGLNIETLNKSFHGLSLQHDMLRARFHRIDEEWIQTISASPTPVDVVTFDLSSVDEVHVEQELGMQAGKLQAALDISNGTMISSGYFDMGDMDSMDRLCIVIHHLVVDTVSWRALIEDLETIYLDNGDLERSRLPQKTTSYREWAKTIIDYAHSDARRPELDFWLSLPTLVDYTIPIDFADGRNTEESECKFPVSLNTMETRSLLTEIPAVYNTRIDDILLTAMARTICSWMDNDVLLLGMEGHGREPIEDQIDLSRTVGWFTSYYPVMLKLDASEPGNAIKSVKEQLRRIPNQGIGYGILRYYAEANSIRNQLDEKLSAQILYNYLGQINRSVDTGRIFELTEEDCGPHHDPQGPRSHILEIDSMIVRDQLVMEWIYSENIHRSSTIQRLAHVYMDNLRELIDHCLAAEAGEISASDFPQANLAQDDLDDLLKLLED